MKLLKYNFFNKYIEQRKIGLVIGVIIFGIGFFLSLFGQGKEVATILVAVGGIYSLFSLIFIYYAKKDLDKLDNKIVSDICNNIENEKFIYHEEIGILAFDEYFIDLYSRFEIIKYNELLWIYLFNENFYPKIYFRHSYSTSFIGVYLKNGEERKVYINKNPMTYYQANEFIKYVNTKNTDVVVGYDKEIRDKMNDILSDNKNNR